MNIVKSFKKYPENWVMVRSQIESSQYGWDDYMNHDGRVVRVHHDSSVSEQTELFRREVDIEATSKKIEQYQANSTEIVRVAALLGVRVVEN